MYCEDVDLSWRAKVCEVSPCASVRAPCSCTKSRTANRKRLSKRSTGPGGTIPPNGLDPDFEAKLIGELEDIGGTAPPAAATGPRGTGAVSPISNIISRSLNRRRVAMPEQIDTVVRFHDASRLAELKRCVLLVGQTYRPLRIVLVLQRFDDHQIEAVEQALGPLLEGRDAPQLVIVNLTDPSW